MSKGLSLQQKQILHLLACHDGQLAGSQVGRFILDAIYGLPEMPAGSKHDQLGKRIRPAGTYYSSEYRQLFYIKTPSQCVSVSRSLKRLFYRNMIDRVTTTEQGQNPVTGKPYTYEKKWIRLTPLGAAEVEAFKDLVLPWQDNG